MEDLSVLRKEKIGGGHVIKTPYYGSLTGIVLSDYWHEPFPGEPSWEPQTKIGRKTGVYASLQNPCFY